MPQNMMVFCLLVDPRKKLRSVSMLSGFAIDLISILISVAIYIDDKKI